jgi:hypothetical protein
MASKPASLGEDSRNFVLKKEEHALPKSRRDIVQLFETLLNKGGAQKITVELGKPVVVYRFVDGEEKEPELLELPEDDLYLASRNYDVIDFKTTESGSYELLFRAFIHLSMSKFKARAFFFNDKKVLQNWLDVAELVYLDELFGVPVKYTKDLPQGSGLLVAGSADEEVVCSLRLDLNLPTT